MSRRPEPTARLLVVAAALLGLLVLSWALAQMGLGAWSTPVALSIAAVKAGLVVWFFMELNEASSSMRIAGVVVLFMLAVLLLLIAADPATRTPPPVLPPGV